MNNEITKILEFKEDADYKRLSVGEILFLKNYLTNLQTIEQQYSAILSENAELENKITNLQEENERLKEQIEILTSDEDNNSVWLEDYNI